MSEAVWDKAFTQGSRALQDRLKKVHAKNPKFQAWLQKSGHGAGASVKQASKEVKATERVKKLQAKSLAAYGATKGVKVGGEHGSDEVRDTIAPLTRDQHSKVQAAERASKAAAKAAAPKAKKPLSKAQRMAAIAAAVRKSKTKHDVPTVDPDDMDHDDLRDLHQSLHVSRSYNEEVESVNEDQAADMQKIQSMDKGSMVGGKTELKTHLKYLNAMHTHQKKYGLDTAKTKKKIGDVSRSLVQMGEEVEQIDEIDQKTLKSYINKSIETGRADDAKGAHNLYKATSKVARNLSTSTLKNKVSKLKYTSMAKHKNPFEYQVSRDELGNRKVSEEVEVNEGKMKDIVTNRKETERLKAQDVLGGPVKTRTGAEPKGKLPLGFRAARNLARKAMNKGAPVTEGYEYTNIGHPPEHSVDIDPQPISDPLKLSTKRKKPVQYKSGMKNGVRIREESTEEKQMSKGKLLAKAIMAKQSKHPLAQNMGEEVKDAADVGEYDYEGDMAKSQLRSILAHAKRLHDMLEDQDNLPEWVQSKITLAQDYIMTAADYMEGEMNEETIRSEEAIFEAMKKMADKMDDEEDDDMEDEEEDDDKKKEKMDEKYMGFAAVKKAVAAKGARDPAAVAAYIGRKKYGKEKFQAMAAAGKRKANEEVVAEAEGKIAVTPKEKELAAHHGDPKKITYGDVIKARIKSAAEKAMNKGK